MKKSDKHKIKDSSSDEDVNSDESINSRNTMAEGMRYLRMSDEEKK